jgi:magnesium transporter
MPKKPHPSLSHLAHEAFHHMDYRRIVGRLIRRTGKAPGLAPGTVIHTGPRRVEVPRMEVIRFGPDHLSEEVRDQPPRPLAIPEEGGGVLWLNLIGLHDVELLQELGDAVGAHPLAMEDVASIGQRPKVEDYGDHLFIVLHMLHLSGEPARILDEQVSLIVAPGVLLSFQEAPGDVFDPVRDRLRSGRGRIRGMGSDYLAYTLIDALADHYFQVTEQLGEQVEALEAEIMASPTQASLHRLHHFKGELLALRRSVWPLRELTAAFLRVESPWIGDTTRIYLRDVHDHSYQLIDAVEVLRDITAGVRDLHLSTVSNRTNEVMKVLTIMASIFIPLTFVAGVYGMNFEHMPELAYPWAYPGVLLLMLGIALGLLGLFRWRRWI